MKKYVFISLLALVAMCFTGCRSEDAPKHKKTIDLEVRSNDWMWDKDAEQFYCHFDVEEITSDVYNYGEFSLHREYYSGTKDAYQVALPQSQYLWENVEDTAGVVTTIYYQQLVDYRVGFGYVEVQVTNSDYTYAEDQQGYLIQPEYMRFRLQITY